MKYAARTVWLVGLWVSVAAAVIGFFLPWVFVEVRGKELSQSMSRATAGTPLEGLPNLLGKRVGRVVVSVKRGTETITGEWPDLAKLPAHMSGFDVPRVMNRSDTTAAIVVAELLSGQQELGAKSYAVYVLPGFAILIGIFLSRSVSRSSLVGLGIGGACLVIAAAGFWKLLTTDMSALVVSARIGPGLWLSLWAYVGLGILSLVLAQSRRAATRASH